MEFFLVIMILYFFMCIFVIGVFGFVGSVLLWYFVYCFDFVLCVVLCIVVFGGLLFVGVEVVEIGDLGL